MPSAKRLKVVIEHQLRMIWKRIRQQYAENKLKHRHRFWSSPARQLKELMIMILCMLMPVCLIRITKTTSLCLKILYWTAKTSWKVKRMKVSMINLVRVRRLNQTIYHIINLKCQNTSNSRSSQIWTSKSRYLYLISITIQIARTQSSPTRDWSLMIQTILR